MTRVFLAVVLLLGVTLACGQYVPTVTPTPSPHPAPLSKATQTSTPAPTATATPDNVQTVTIQAIVYVRQLADRTSTRIGNLTTGQSVELIGCDGDWCHIRTNGLDGYVFRGCTSDNPDGLRCEAAP